MRRFSAILLLAAVPLLTLAVVQGEPSPAQPPAPMLDAELGVPLGEPLLSGEADVPASMDGVVEAVWDQARGPALAPVGGPALVGRVAPFSRPSRSSSSFRLTVRTR